MISNAERDQLLSEVENLENVVGVAKTGTKGRPCALVSEKKDERDLDDDEIVANNASRDAGVMEIGEIRSHSCAVGDDLLEAHGDRHDRHRPTQAGVSATNIGSTACTLTGVAKVTHADAPTVQRSAAVSEGDYVHAFNCHCAAMGGDAEFGSQVVQPSPYDGGTSEDAVGEFCGYVPLEDGVKTDYSEATINDLEAASAQVHNLDSQYGRRIKRSNYRDLIGTEVVNSGRTVGVKRSIVRAVGASVNVGYSGGKTVKTENAIITKPPDGGPTMSEGGQSGAPVFSESENGALTGVLYAGSDRATILSTIAATEELAGVEFMPTGTELTEDDPGDGGDGGDGGDDGPTPPPETSWYDWILELLRRYRNG